MELGTTLTDPTVTDPDKYVAVFENEHVRVLEYRDRPGDRTKPHRHPASVMITLTGFQRRISSGDGSDGSDGSEGDNTTEVVMAPGRAVWLPAQQHAGHNTGTTDTHVIFVELKGPGAPAASPGGHLGPVQ
jgi:hypothetical protein